MRIAQITSTFPPYEAGIGNVCFNLSKKLSHQGHEVVVFVPKVGQPISDDMDLQFKVEYVKPLFSIGNASLLFTLRKSLSSFDIIHLHYPFFGADFLVRNAALSNKIPYILTYHQDVFGDSMLRKLEFKLYNKLFQKRVVSDACRVVGLSDDHINNSQIRGIIKSDQISICPNGINLEDFSDKNSTLDIRKVYSINDKIPIIAFVGALDSAHYFKRLDILLKSIKDIHGKAHLLVIGDGDIREKFERQVIELEITNNVTFIGRLSNSNVIDYLKQIDFLVLPSTDTESFGIVLIEAMACSKPVIASNLNGVRALIQNGKNGLLFDVGKTEHLTKQINYLIDHKDTAQVMGENGRRIVEQNYTWDLIANKYEKIYTKCIENYSSYK